MDIVDCIHKRVQVFLHRCNTTCPDNVEMGSLLEFGELQRHVERGEWVTTTPVWVGFPTEKEDRERGGGGVESDNGGGTGQTQRKA